MNDELAAVDTRDGTNLRPRSERLFYGAMAALILLAVSVGFARSYYLRGAIAAPPFPLGRLTPVIHMHALLFTGWVLLLMAQTSLVAAGKRDWHRRLGMVAAIWVPMMILTGTLAALRGVVRGTAPPFMEPRRWLAVQVFDLIVFGATVAAGLRARRDPQTHKRLMLVSTIALLPPALGRSPLPSAVFQMGLPGIFGFADLALVPLLLWDLATQGRIHRATLWGGLLLVVSLPLRVAIAKTDTWLAVADWAVDLIR
jgi:hypothetical protein